MPLGTMIRLERSSKNINLNDLYDVTCYEIDLLNNTAYSIAFLVGCSSLALVLLVSCRKCGSMRP